MPSRTVSYLLPAFSDTPDSGDSAARTALARAAQRRFILSAAAAAFLIAFAQSIVEIHHNLSHFPDAFVAGFLVVVAGLASYFVAWLSRGVIRRGALLAYLVILTFTVYLLPFVALNPHHHVRFTPMPLHFVVSAMGLMPLVMGLLPAGLWSIGLLAGVQLVHGSVQPGLDSWLETGVYATFGMIFLIVVALVDRILVDQEERARKTALAGEVIALEQQESASRDWWNGLVHDKILGALRLGAIATTPEISEHAAGLAQEALTALEQENVKFRDDVVGELQAKARELGIHLMTRVTGTRGPLVVGEAALEALTEALVNVKRHSGTNRAMLIGDVNDQRVDLSVIDEGVGFDVTAVPADRLGLRRSVSSRMQAVGGQAKISSSPGNGTSVRVSWSTTAPATAGSLWDPVLFLPLIVCFVALWVLHLLLAVRIPIMAGDWPGILLAAVILSALTVLCWIPRVNRNLMTALTAGAVVMIGVLISLVPLDPLPDYRLWFGGYLVPLCLCLALRGHETAANVAGLGSLLVCLVISAVRMPESLVAVAGALAVPALFTLVGQFFYRVLTDASDEAAVVARRQATMDLELRVLAQRRLIRDERLRELRDRVVPLLRELAHETEPHPHRRERSQRIERTTRDLLVARPLLTAEVRMALERARQRGAKVTMSAELSPVSGPGEAEAIALARRALVPLLEMSGRGSILRVRIDLGSEHEDRMTLLNPQAAARPVAMRELEQLAAETRLLGIVTDCERVELSMVRPTTTPVPGESPAPAKGLRAAIRP